MEVNDEPKSSSPVPRWQGSKLNFLDLTVEIRLKIYEELLVAPEPLSLILSSSPHDLVKSITIRKNSDFPSPQILRVNRQIHHEAIPLLYRHNRFHLSRLNDDFGIYMMPSNDRIVTFLTRMGDYNASLIRHLGIYFPLSRIDPDPVKKEALDFIRARCTSLTTIQILLWNSFNLHGVYAGIQSNEASNRILFVEDLKRIDAELKRNSSLREIGVDFCIWGPWSKPKADGWLREMIHDCGWKVQVTREEYDGCELGAFGTWFD